MGAPKGNQNAKRAKVWSDAVRKAIVQGKKLEPLAEKLIDEALSGNMVAMKEIGDRLEGKPMQETHNTHDVTETRHYSDTELLTRLAGLLAAGFAERDRDAGEGSHADMDADTRSAERGIPH